MNGTKNVESQSYTVRKENGAWLGQIVLTSDGMFAGLTDYGNLSFAWRSFGGDTLQEFKEFIIGLNTGYFSSKMYTGLAYIAYGRKYERACATFAEEVLPPLQELLKKELEENTP